MFLFCDKIMSRNQFKPHKRLFSNYTFSCYDNITDIHENEWNEAIADNNVFLTYNYLKLVHYQQTDNFRFRYVIVYNRKKPIGVVYFQINDFSASVFGDLVEKQINDLQSRRASLFQRYIEHNGHETVMRLVTCGNNFISGEHGFYLNINSKKTKFKVLEQIIECVARSEKLRGKISAILVKDFYEEGFGNKDCWYCRKFKHFNVEPNMIIDLPKGLNSLQDYLNHFSKKYRQRAKHILKAGETLTKKRLSIDDVILHNERIHELYSQVFEKAKFKLVHLSKDYFKELIKTNGTNVYMDAWFLGDKMVSFASGFCLPNEVEAHYIGFDYEINKEYELYQNILYSYIEQAIIVKKSSINLGRTASEIKSTVGAKAHDLMCYIKPQNTVSKLILNPFMQFLQPSDWVPRNPFKETE